MLDERFYFVNFSNALCTFNIAVVWMNLRMWMNVDFA